MERKMGYTLSLRKSLVDKIDIKRGQKSRSVFIEGILEDYLGDEAWE